MMTLKIDAVFTFDENMICVFNKTQKEVCSANTLGLYDWGKELTLEVDASQKGLGPCLLQNDIPNAFASKSLTPAGKN